jgi:hypothetical protein
MAITLPIMNPQIVPPDASSSSVALWEVRLEFPGSAPLAICDTQREAEAFVGLGSASRGLSTRPQ